MVDAAKDWVETGAGEQVGRPVPADVVDRVEGVGHFRYGDGEDGSVLWYVRSGSVRVFWVRAVPKRLGKQTCTCRA